ncbi:MAG: hypothetical protein VX346_28630 [Planctomycetota bacterium]|nr:hypothetical protein [Planctomycetota bacterium]
MLCTVLLWLTGQVVAALATEPLRALERFPALSQTFPFGFWYAQAPMDEDLSGAFQETYRQRRGKLFHHLARHYTNALITANRIATIESLDAAGEYGIGLISPAEFLHGHINHAGELTGEVTMEQVLQQAVAHASQVKSHPQLLAYLVFDEPRAAAAAKIQRLSDVFFESDSSHPAIYTHADMPLDAARKPAEWKLLQSRDVILSDCYSITARSGRDPWLYGDVYLSELRRANPHALQWPIIQAFTKPYTIHALPTPAELRVMVYHTVASGAKGMLFFTTNQAYLGSWARRHWFYRGSGNPWFGREPLMDEIGRLGGHLATAGPLLVPLHYRPDYPVHVGTVDAPLGPAESFSAYVLGVGSEVADGGMRTAGELQREAIHVGTFSGDDYDVLVIHNNDPWGPRTAAVTLQEPRALLLDLATLELVSTETTAAGKTFPVSFMPGDGRLYLAGDGLAVDAARRAVWSKRYAHERRLLQRDIDLARAGRVDVSQTLQLVTVAAAETHPQVAYERLGEARQRLQQAEMTARDYNQVRRHVEAARKSFGEIQQAFYRAPVQPIDEISSPALRELERRVLAMSRNFTRIENALRVGSWDLTDAYVLEREVGQLAVAVRNYRPDDLVEKSIVVVGWPGVGGGQDPETAALAERLRWMYSNVRLHTVRGDGTRHPDADTQGNDDPIDWQKQDLVWVHLSGRSTGAQTRYCVSADLAAGVAAATKTAAWRRYSDAGGSVVLSGLAGCLVAPWGWETSPPNDRYWGTMIVPGHGPSRHRSAARPEVEMLGHKPVDATHAIFSGLPAEGFATMEANAAELVTAAVWQRPPTTRTAWRAPFWPEHGTVLAGYWTDGTEVPPDYATIVEYSPHGHGRGMVVGGAFDPRVSTDRVRRGEHYDQLLRNLVEYMTNSR